MTANDLKIHHLGYAVPTIESGIDTFSTLGWSQFGEITDDVSRNVRITFMSKNGQVIELVAPLAKPNPVEKVLATGAGAPYHICYEVSSISEAVAYLKGKKFIPFIQPAMAPALDGREVQFLFHKNLGIIEVVEKKKE